MAGHLDHLVASLVPWPLRSRAADLRRAEPRKSEFFHCRTVVAQELDELSPGGPPDALAWALALAAQIATIHDDTILGSVENRWALFVPILGLDAGRDILSALGARGVENCSRVLLERYCDDHSLPTVKRAIRRRLRYYPVVINDREDASALADRLQAWFGGEELR